MKNFLEVLLIFGWSLFLFGCECYPTQKGIIVDELTHMPISNALVKFGNSSTYSNTHGQFEASATGCDLKMTVSKENYKDFGVSMSTENGKLIIRIDNEYSYRKLDKPKYLNSDSTSFLVEESVQTNSNHFEYFGSSDSLKIYLEKR